MQLRKLLSVLVILTTWKQKSAMCHRQVRRSKYSYRYVQMYRTCERFLGKFPFLKPFSTASIQSYPGLFYTSSQLKQLSQSTVKKLDLPAFGPPNSVGEPAGSYIMDVSGVVFPDDAVQDSGCCSTEIAYVTYNTTEIQDIRYPVVNFQESFQYVHIGRCRHGHQPCPGGICTQIYRHHWMLIWNSSAPFWPPVHFSPVQVPSHCACINIGQ